jgi:hypothetical protein
LDEIKLKELILVILKSRVKDKVVKSAKLSSKYLKPLNS